VLAKDPALRDPSLEDFRPHRFGLALPALGVHVLVITPGEPGAAVERHPGHELRGDVVLRRSASLPDPLVGLAPDLHCALDLLADKWPEPVRQSLLGLRVDVGGVEERAVDVVLA